MEMIYIWVCGLGGALLALGVKWLYEELEDMRLDLEELREEVREINVSRICDK